MYITQQADATRAVHTILSSERAAEAQRRESQEMRGRRRPLGHVGSRGAGGGAHHVVAEAFVVNVDVIQRPTNRHAQLPTTGVQYVAPPTGI